MDMKEVKVKKLKEQFKKTYLDTVKHANDIEKWIDSGNRKQGDIRRSIERLDSKYQSLLEIKNVLINQNSNEYIDLNKIEDELEFNKFEDKLSQKTEMTMNQIKEKIHNLYKLAKIQQPQRDDKQNKEFNNIELVTDIPGNEKALYYLEKRKGFLTKRKEHHRRKIFNIKESIIDKYYDIKSKLKHRKKEKINQNKNDKFINEYEEYCLEMQKGFLQKRIDKIVKRFSFTRKNNKEKNKKYKKVGRVSALFMASALALFGGTTVGESDANKIKESNNDKSYVDINKKEDNNFKKSLYFQALEETTTPSTVQETTIKTDEQIWNTHATSSTFTQPTTEVTETIKENNENQNTEKEEKIQNQQDNKNIEYKESADDVYILKANTIYTENSLGGGETGYISKDTKVKTYNRALVNTDKNGEKTILYVTNPGEKWEDYAKRQGQNYEEFKRNFENPNNQEMVSLDSENGESSYGWVEFNTLEQINKSKQKGETER